MTQWVIPKPIDLKSKYLVAEWRSPNSAKTKWLPEKSCHLTDIEVFTRRINVCRNIEVVTYIGVLNTSEANIVANSKK